MPCCTTGVTDVTRLAGPHGIIVGDLNIKDMDDFISYADRGAGNWRKLGGPKDWILAGIGFGMKSSPVTTHAGEYKSDVHYPVAVRVTSNLDENNRANSLVADAIGAMAGPWTKPDLQAGVGWGEWATLAEATLRTVVQVRLGRMWQLYMYLFSEQHT